MRNLLKEEKCPSPIWGYSSAPEPLGDVMLYHVGGKDGNVLALDPENGKTQWRVGGDQKAGYAPPLVIPHSMGSNSSAGDQTKSWDCQWVEEMSYGVSHTR